ncbi:beta strand repeat-containing protein [Prescottella agglutinans]|uniref:beta strand repeat-containing protein n=1 Tax=Prescottella agglutinans TaxID=1644129 RepID=UPI003D978471
MQNPLLRRCAAPITGAALVAGTLVIAVAPANAAVATTNFKNACQASATITVHKVADTSMQVDAPSAVEPGQTFTYRIQPGGAFYPNSDSGATTTNVSRLKVDYEIPANATFVSATVVPGTGINLDGVAPGVLRVNESGNPDGAGNILRLSGNNQTISNGPSTSTNSEGGIRAPKLKKDLNGNATGGDSWFRLPAVDVTMVAGSPGVITPKVRTAGNAANYNANESYYTFLPLASFFGNQWAPTRCTPRDSQSAGLNAGAGPLATINVVASQVSTTTNLTAPATAETGAPVTLTANVAPTNATGSVQFQDNGANIGSAVPVSGGAASLSHTFSSAGSHSITAVFTGTGNFTGSTSSAQTVTVSDPTPVDVTTTLALTVPQNAETGTAVDLTANVTPSNAAGTVQFKDNGANIGTPVTVSGGAATLSHTFAAAGAHAITADFVGAPGFAGSAAGAQTVTVTDPVVPDVETTTTVSAPANAATGASVTLTANVAPQNATGTVQFTDNGANIGSPVAVSNGVATLPHTFQAAGNHAIGAAFTGDAGFASSTATQTQNVTVTDPDVVTTTALTVPQNAETGTAVDLTANVTPANAVGSVQFKDNGTNIGAPVQVSNGVATLSHQFAAAGSHSITATFTGGAGFAGSSAGAQTVTVTDPVVPDTETTTTVTAPTGAETGEQVTLSATVAPVPTGGTVQFKVAGAAVGAPVNVDGSGHASMPYTFNAAGSYAVTADYSGTAGFAGSTASARTVTVTDPTPADVETSLALGVQATAETGDDVDLTATVTPANAQGTVQFSINGAPVGTPVQVSGGTATLSHLFGTAGSFSVTAAFTGGAGFTNSAAGAQTITVTDPVVPDTQTTTTVSAPTGAETGEQVTLSATVAPVPTGGTVQFKVAGAAVGAPVNVDGSGHASMPYTFNAAGSYAVTADYSGAAGFTASTASAQTVTVSDPTPVDAATTTILSVPGNAKTGEAQDLVATVYDNGTEEVIPSVGTVQFFDGGAPIGTAQVANGVATLSHTFTTAATHTITATFSGATGFIGSTAEAKQVVVTVPTPVDVETATVVTVPANATVGTQVQLSAQVTGAGNAAVTGTVQFFDGATPIGDAVQVVNGVATLNHTFTTSGAHSIRAEFSGGQGVANSTSSAQTVQVSGGSPGGSLGNLGSLSAILGDLLGGLNFGS